MYNLNFNLTNPSLPNHSHLSITTKNGPTNKEEAPYIQIQTESIEETTEIASHDQLNELQFFDKDVDYSDLNSPELIIAASARKYYSIPIHDFDLAAKKSFKKILLNMSLFFSSFISNKDKLSSIIHDEKINFFREEERIQFLNTLHKKSELLLEHIDNFDCFLVLRAISPFESTEGDLSRLSNAIDARNSYLVGETAHFNLINEFKTLTENDELNLFLRTSLSTALLLANTFSFSSTNLLPTLSIPVLNKLDENPLAEFTTLFILCLLEKILIAQYPEKAVAHTHTVISEIREEDFPTISFQQGINDFQYSPDVFYNQYTLNWAESTLFDKNFLSNIQDLLEKRANDVANDFIESTHCNLPLHLKYFSDWITLTLISAKPNQVDTPPVQLIKQLSTPLFCQIFETLSKGLITFTCDNEVHYSDKVDAFMQYKDILICLISKCTLDKESVDKIIVASREALLSCKIPLNEWIDFFQLFETIQLAITKNDSVNRNNVLIDLVNVAIKSISASPSFDPLQQREWLHEGEANSSLITINGKFVSLITGLAAEINMSFLEAQNKFETINLLEAYLACWMKAYAEAIVELINCSNGIGSQIFKKKPIQAEEYLRTIHLNSLNYLIALMQKMGHPEVIQFAQTINMSLKPFNCSLNPLPLDETADASSLYVDEENSTPSPNYYEN